MHHYCKFSLFIHTHTGMCRVHAVDFSCTWLLAFQNNQITNSTEEIQLSLQEGTQRVTNGQTTGAQQTSSNLSSTKLGMERLGLRLQFLHSYRL